jgi:hypothetical protein
MMVLLHTLLSSALDRGRWLASPPDCLLLGERSPQYPVARRLKASWSWPGRFEEEKNIVVLMGGESVQIL